MIAFKLTPALWLVLDAIAVFRLTRLVTTDRITEKGRTWVRDHMGMAWFDFVSCAWCTSVWIAGGAVLATLYVPGQWKYLAYLLTCSAVAGMLADR